MSALGQFTLMLATLSIRLTEVAEAVRAFPGVRLVTTDVSPRSYESGPRIEAYVDAELESGNSLAWWLELYEDGGSWVVESSILHTTSQGQDQLRELPARYAVNAGELASEVGGATDALISSVGADEVGQL